MLLVRIGWCIVLTDVPHGLCVCPSPLDRNEQHQQKLKIEGLPESVSEEMLKGDESFLRAFHHALLEVEVQEGALICPETGRRFPITKGIPNLLLNEDEC